MTDPANDLVAPGGGRRRFVDWFMRSSMGGLLTAMAYPILRFLSPPHVPEAATTQLEAGPANDPELLARGFRILRFGAEPVILIRVADGDFRAFAATCTHLACIVEFRKPQSDLHCNCHDGCFDLTGRNVSGPPPRPLTPLVVHVLPSKGEGQAPMLIVSRA